MQQSVVRQRPSARGRFTYANAPIACMHACMSVRGSCKHKLGSTLCAANAPFMLQSPDVNGLPGTHTVELYAERTQSVGRSRSRITHARRRSSGAFRRCLLARLHVCKPPKSAIEHHYDIARQYCMFGTFQVLQMKTKMHGACMSASRQYVVSGTVQWQLPSKHKPLTLQQNPAPGGGGGGGGGLHRIICCHCVHARIHIRMHIQ